MTRAFHVLAWDTSTPWCTLTLDRFAEKPEAVTLGGRLRLEGGRHSQILPVEVAGILNETGLSPAEVDLLVVGRGPGSFTGLRTGLAFAKGLALGAGTPVMGLSSLAAVALTAGDDPEAGEALLAPVIDARHGQVFTALYERTGGDRLRPLSPAAPVFPENFPNFVLNAARQAGLFPRPVLAAGPGTPLLAEAFPQGPPDPLAFSARPCPPLASALARLGRRLHLDDPRAAELHPPLALYARRPDIRQSGIVMH